ncbi:MBL fold metallo-hydrolase [Aquibacillus rhizosphaerae]|uniref:MBL fold metallo-hydrolase n=1 Tax=Aquibacillus rhizosphaerae TaxID=3051431 RepID=A0ABT7LA92_9BACI|nr:MBL fold metallo-hydrolase [Aquibacillus sp. LR5S19]MDL4842784.1 MBL fold metallo-hydrolase [Aquibacillus sp. LR5S19]
MRITVIGFWGAYPEQGSATSCYLLEKDGYSCLLDCGSGALSRLQSYKDVMDIDAVVLSHYHNDHIADVGVLQYSWLVQNSIQNTNKVLPIYGHSEDEENFKKLTHNSTKGISYDPTRVLEIGPFRITFMKTKHPVPCFAMRVTDGEKSFVYTADSSYIDSFISFSEGADLLISECSFYENQDGTKVGHMNSKECADIARKANIPELILSHHPHFGNTQDLVREAQNYYAGNIQLAREGLTWGF